MYRRRQAAYGAGLTAKSLHNWTTLYDLDLFEARPDRGWRTFSENDVFIMAIAAQLVRYGCHVKTAVQGVRTALGMVDFKTFNNLPTYLYAAELNGQWLIDSDEGLISMPFANGAPPALVRVFVTRCIADARRRLATADSV